MADDDIRRMVERLAREDDALELFRGGLAPSECDRACGLAPGTTHNEVVSWWAALRQCDDEG